MFTKQDTVDYSKLPVPKAKTGMAIGVICPGTVPIKWMMHMYSMDKSLPGGLYWSYVYATGDFKKDPSKNYASLRNEVVDKAREMGVKWLFFLDSDVFIPTDCLNRLMAHDVDIVTGIYWMKTQPPQPVIYKNIGDGPIWKIKPQDDLLEIGGAGMGCCLIKMEVFDKFAEKGINFFEQDWTHERDGRQIQVSIGEDHWFFNKARELGYKVWCDTNVLCDHYDVNTDIFYPEQKVVKDIAKTALQEGGQQELLDHNLMVRNIEKDKPTITFFNFGGVPFNGHSINEKAISGSETAIIQMAKNMKELGWNSHVFCNCDTEGHYDNVSYYQANKVSQGMVEIERETGKKINVFVSSRDIRPFLGGRPNVDKTILWVHDMPFCEGYDKLLEAMVNIDHIMFLSKAQMDAFQVKFDNKIPREKIVMTVNGIDEKRFENKKCLTKKRKRCVYTTTPFRGLDVLMGVWPKIKARVPNAELFIYSDMSIYNQEPHPEIKRIFEYGKTIAKDNNIFFSKPVKQDKLADVLLDADIMLYPNHYPETFCITAIESIKAKTPIITSKLGALPEVIKSDEGILIEGDPHSDEYAEKFVEAAVKMLSDDEYRDTFCTKDRDFSWKTVAKGWINLFKGESLKISFTKDGKINFNSKEYWDRKYKEINDTNFVNKGDIERNEFLAKLIPSNAYILDIGCGDGDLLKHLYDNQIGTSLSGVDISEEGLKLAKLQVPLADLTQIGTAPIELPIKNMDIITCIHTIEHLDKPELYIEEWKKSLKKGGEMILIIPLDDEEYYEHLDVYDLGKVEKLAKSVSKDYELKTRNQGWKYKNGRNAKEAVIRLWFD